MKKLFTCLCSLVIFQSVLLSQTANWQPVPGRIASSWSADVDPSNVLSAYPRPQMKRSSWTNLNGLWQYVILPLQEGNKLPGQFAGEILVPFAIESSLSGVGKTVGKDSVLWYQRSLQLQTKQPGKKYLMHFGAVDWRCEVWINGQPTGSHEGGFDPFTIDITSALKKGTNQIAVKVWDPTTDGPQPRGKQVKNPEGIWYTPVTGIWQTVWMEAVPSTYIISTKNTPDLDKGVVHVNVHASGMLPGDRVRVRLSKGGLTLATMVGDSAVTLPVAQPDEWSPDHPALYNLQVEIIRKGKVIDEVASYCAMRKSSLAADANGIQRMMLNNKFVFQFGPLDQGWWPDGLYTAPTDEALKYDIIATKNMGFNMIRKHIKVEPARWYYYCDSIGIMVWQDMPSGDLGNGWEMRLGVIGRGTDQQRTAQSEGYYRKEWNAIMDALHNFPSIVAWVPFNEAWGQFKTQEISEWTKAKDPSRLVNSASGGNFYNTGDIVDLHSYPDPAMPDPAIFGKDRAVVLGEFGGLGLPVEGHIWQKDKNWGYQTFKNSNELITRYESLIKRLGGLIPLGLSAAVYTQTTDVEGEVNGFITYDRKVMKMPIDQLKTVNSALYAIGIK